MEAKRKNIQVVNFPRKGHSTELDGRKEFM